MKSYRTTHERSHRLRYPAGPPSDTFRRFRRSTVFHPAPNDSELRLQDGEEAAEFCKAKLRGGLEGQRCGVIG